MTSKERRAAREENGTMTARDARLRVGRRTMRRLGTGRSAGRLGNGLPRSTQKRKNPALDAHNILRANHAKVAA